MCNICDMAESLGFKPPYNHRTVTKKSYRDQLVDERATLSARLQIIDELLDKLDKHLEIEEFINLADRN